MFEQIPPAWYADWGFWAIFLLALTTLSLVFGPWVKAKNPNDPRQKHTPPE